MTGPIGKENRNTEGKVLIDILVKNGLKIMIIQHRETQMYRDIHGLITRVNSIKNINN